uniref:Hypothetical conserved protein n=1 Tax=uncultured Planctomycetota bacterium TaxID=120965 RepID=H5SJR8_9BACT|nr:hypothetical conserved protein [uncultured Planctomycetota bacterium]
MTYTTERWKWPDALAVAVVASACVLPNLGAHSLWDVDEARNAECAREMWEAGDWIVPTFNYELRTDKPILPYWLMMVSFEMFGVSEWAARWPSAVAGIVTCVLSWWLAASMFGRETALLAGLLLPGAVLFNVLSHAVTPDALLMLWTTAALLSAWRGGQNGQACWLGWFGAWTGLAVLTKGVVGILLPMTAVGWFLIWERRLRVLASRWLVWGVGILLGVVLPWYVAVGVATKGEWLRGFFGRHHYERFTTPLEGHSGGLWYHPVMLLVGFAPWSVWLAPVVWCVARMWWERRRAMQTARSSAVASPPSGESEPGMPAAMPDWPNRQPLQPAETSALRFLICWCGTWLIFFSVARTKLPNYVAPIYPALAILTAWWMVSWRAGRMQVARWVMGTGMAVWAFVGAGVSLGLMFASGTLPLPVLQGHTVPGLAWLVWLGVIPIVGAVGAAYAWRKDKRLGVLVSLVSSGLVFVALGAAIGPVLVHPAKVAHRLGQTIRQSQTEPEIRVACYGWFQPSIVFYVQRPVANLREVQEACDWLDHPLESYLIVSRPWWEERLLPALKTSATVLACYWDFTRRREILVIVNRSAPGHSPATLSFQEQAQELRQMMPGRGFDEAGGRMSQQLPGLARSAQE